LLVLLMTDALLVEIFFVSKNWVSVLVSVSSLLWHKSTTTTESSRIAARTLDCSTLRGATRSAAGGTLNLRGRVETSFSTLIKKRRSSSSLQPKEQIQRLELEQR
jgi:hypothetical protein